MKHLSLFHFTTNTAVNAALAASRFRASLDAEIEAQKDQRGAADYYTMAGLVRVDMDADGAEPQSNCVAHRPLGVGAPFGLDDYLLFIKEMGLSDDCRVGFASVALDSDAFATATLGRFTPSMPQGIQPGDSFETVMSMVESEEWRAGQLCAYVMDAVNRKRLRMSREARPMSRLMVYETLPPSPSQFCAPDLTRPAVYAADGERLIHAPQGTRLARARRLGCSGDCPDNPPRMPGANQAHWFAFVLIHT